ncbi:class IV adenylate cyclase [Candidatus Woesearchaeota archaeon]|nr:class IV adenylate cyclase [Candidatus Woesearchaeota archaeon]
MEGWYEVELKARVKDSDAFRQKIKKIAKFVKKVKKIDDYYTLEKKGYPTKSLRIRNQGSFHLVNFKKRVSYVQGIYTKKETEFNLQDIKGFLAVLKEFGFRLWITKHKESEVYKYKSASIELNHLRGLGWFVEVEILTVDNVSEARKTILAIFKLLGINKKDIEKKGYTKLLWEKQNKK